MDSSKPVVPVMTDRAPAPAGHYAQATVAGQVLYVSGQLPIRPDGTLLRGASFDEQSSQAIDNMLAIVAAAGATPAQIARVTAYIVGVEHWPRFNAIYAAKLGSARPARSVVPVPELHHGLLVEIEAVALLGA